MIVELQKIASIENIVDRKIYFLGLLTRECEKKGFRPIVVGGSAIEFYTEGIYSSYDIDLIGPRRLIGKILEEEFGFKPSGRHWINEEIELFVEIPNSYLTGDKSKITTIKIKDLVVYLLGLEDLILDRIRACIHWKSLTDCEQAKFLLKEYQSRLDLEYLEKKAKEEGELRVLKRLVEGKDIWKTTPKGQVLWYKEK